MEALATPRQAANIPFYGRRSRAPRGKASETVLSKRTRQIDALRQVSQIIEQVTVQFPVSQAIVPLGDTFDWLLDDVSPRKRWIDAQKRFQHKFAQRWHTVAAHALSTNPHRGTGQALQDAYFDPLNGRRQWGVELTRALRATLEELGPIVGKANGSLPNTKQVEALAQAAKLHDNRFTLPVVAYTPLSQSEWRAILDGLEEIIKLALSFGGVALVWLVGGFVKNQHKALIPHTQLTFKAPPPGTRFKPVRVLLGTTYEEQCPSLVRLVREVRGNQPRPSDSLLRQTQWHRVVVQLDVAEQYEMFDLDRFSAAERRIAREIEHSDPKSRRRHVVRGKVHEVPRPWQCPEPVSQRAPNELSRPPASVTSILPPRSQEFGTNILIERPAPQGVYRVPSPPAAPTTPTTENLGQDAETLRYKGTAVLGEDPTLAQKYLLASTMLENTSVDIWLTLMELATNTKQRNSFHREAEKLLRRQRREKWR